MKNGHLFTLTILAIVVGFSGPASAQLECDKTFAPPGDEGDWMDEDNWDPSGEPSSSDVACIPADKTAVIEFDDGVAESLWIKADEEDTGRVEVIGDRIVAESASLTLGTAGPSSPTDSIIDGELALIFDAHLKIKGQITMTGTGKVFLYPDAPGINIATIDSGALYATLTLEGEHAYSWTLYQCQDRSDTTLTVMGGGEINVPLVNEAHVTTWEEDFDLLRMLADRELTINESSSGGGCWVAEVNPDDDGRYGGDVGILDVRANISGAGNWILHTDKDAEIRINSTVNTDGNVLIENGTFLVNENFTTEGELEFYEYAPGPRDSRIIVSSGHVARFNAFQP